MSKENELKLTIDVPGLEQMQASVDAAHRHLAVAISATSEAIIGQEGMTLMILQRHLHRLCKLQIQLFKQAG